MNNIENDILDWLVNYIEVPHLFYNYKFPPCPFAKTARLKGLINIKAYDSKGIFKFLDTTIENHMSDTDHTMCIMAFPSYTKLNWFFTRYLRNKNKFLVQHDYYIQYGKAINTKSKFQGIGQDKPYFIVIVNKLSDVISGHEQLLKTDYYSNWSDFHYYDVVERRNIMIEKYKKENSLCSK
jgi:hypothetical protein